MAESASSAFPSDLQRLYARLSRQDIEEFYAGYQLWQARQRATLLQAQIETLRRQIAANAERMRLLQPSEQALAALETLRHYGVTDLALLDRLLECGEAWLVRMLDYLEQCQRLGLFDGDYTRWCQHALEGAYDWMASIGEESTSAQEPVTSLAEEGAAQPVLTEEEFLRRLIREETAPLPTSSPAPAEQLAPAAQPLETAPGSSAQAEVIPLPPDIAWQLGTEKSNDRPSVVTNGSNAAAAAALSAEAESAPSPAQSAGPLALVTAGEQRNGKERAEAEEEMESSAAEKAGTLDGQEGELYEFTTVPSAEVLLPGAGEQIALPAVAEETDAGEESLAPAAGLDARPSAVPAAEEADKREESTLESTVDRMAIEPEREVAMVEIPAMVDAAPQSGDEQPEEEGPVEAAMQEEPGGEEAETAPPRESEAAPKLSPWQRFFGRRSVD
jgi:hypothetical protein